MNERTVGSLTVDDVGQTVTLSWELATVTGVIRSVKHERWSTVGKTFLVLKSGDYSWMKNIDSDTPVTVLDPESVEVTG